MMIESKGSRMVARARSSVSSTSSVSVCGKIVGAAVAFLVALIAYAAQSIYFRHWYTQDPAQYASPGIFRTNTTFVRRDIPVTYYRRSNMRDVLPKGGWIRDASISGLQVFRLEHGEEPPNIMDPNVLNKLSGPTRAVGVNPDCPNSHGFCALCPTKRDEQCKNETDVRSVDTVSVLNGTARDVYSSFSEISPNAIQELVNMMGWQAPEEDFKLGLFEHCFASNFRKRMFPTTVHNNPLTQSMAFQFVGCKHWIFFTPEDYYDEKGFRSIPATPACFPSRAPRKKVMHYYTVTTQPGDFLYFPIGYAHMVANEPGPNLLITFRKLFPRAFLKAPLMALHAFVNRAIPYLNSYAEDIPTVLPDGKVLDQLEKNKVVRGKASAPDTALSMHPHLMICPTVCVDKDPTNVDLIMGKLMNDYADAVMISD